MSESKQYKLTYFNGRGLGENARLLFAAAGVQYEDNRVDKDAWAELKPKTPFGTLPVLEVDGVQIPQSQAISRFLAKRFGFFGSNDVEAALIDSYLEVLIDLRTGLFTFFREQDPELKKKKLEEYLSGDVVKYTTFLEKHLSKHNEGKGWLVGDKISVADIHLYYSYWSLLKLQPEVLKDFPLVAGLVERVAANPGIAEWVKNRPETSF